MKHAYLILAHTDFALLKLLVSKIDDPRNDIFIHVDKKSRMDVPVVANQARLIFLPGRKDVRWGDISMVEAELELFREAYQNGPYDFYHLLSGCDLPIKSQDFIHDFCDKNRGKLFVGLSICSDDEINRRARVYIPFTRLLRSRNIFVRGIRAIVMNGQRILHITRNQKPIFKGSQWCSLPNDFVGYILSKEKEIFRTFRYTFAPDEMFIQTLCMNSSYKKKLFNIEDEWEGCLRYINWEDGELRQIEDKDIEQMLSSNKLFARKFDSRRAVTYRICKAL